MRINAALALGVPEHRALYGQHFSAVWTALLAGLDNSEHMADFNEYKHRDALLDQVLPVGNENIQVIYLATELTPFRPFFFSRFVVLCAILLH